MDIKKLLESIDKLTEETATEDLFTDVPAEEPEVAPAVEPAFNDGMSLADTFDTKAKIARSLENLKLAVEEFKEATAEKIDLLKDELLLGGLDELDEVIKGLELALASGSNLLGDSELNDAFKAELPQGEEKEEETEAPSEDNAETDEIAPVELSDEENAEDEKVESEEYDFDSEAGFNLLSDENE